MTQKSYSKNRKVFFYIGFAMFFLAINTSFAQNNYWEINGNNSTLTLPIQSRINAASFIGSTDPNIPLNLKTTQNQPMQFFTNNTQRMILTINDQLNLVAPTAALQINNQNILWHKGEIRSIFIGVNAGANTTGVNAFQNTFVGHNAGTSNISGQRNTFIGASAGESIKAASFNTFVGTDAGKMLTSGNHNTFVGEQCADKQISGNNNSYFGAHTAQGPIPNAGTGIGNDNTFLGAFAGSEITNGNGNTFSGVNAGRNCANGSNNTFTGLNTGNQCSTGSRNTMNGFTAGLFTTSGNDNVFVGNRAGFFNSTGSNNTYIGTNTGTSTFGNNTPGNMATNATAIGNGAQIRKSNVMILGNNLVNVGIGLSNDVSIAQGPQNKLEIDAGLNGLNPAANNTIGSSGLRFRDLHSGNIVIHNGINGVDTTKVLSVDENGDVVLVNSSGGAGSSLGNICGDSITNPLNYDWEIPLNHHNLYFTGTNGIKDRVSVGLSCGTGLQGKFNTLLDTTYTTNFNIGNNSGHFLNSYTGSGHNVAIKGEVTNGIENNSAGYFRSTSPSSTARNYGITSIVQNGGIYNIGGSFKALGGANTFGVQTNVANGTTWTVGGKFDIPASSSPQNYGINCNVIFASNPNATNWGGLFYLSNITNVNYGIQAITFSGTQNYAIYGKAQGPGATPGTINDWAGYFDGNVMTTATQYFTSDKDLKKDIKNIESPLKKIMNLHPSYFLYDTVKGAQHGMTLPKGYNYGFIAQDVELIFPELVTNTESAPLYDSTGSLLFPRTNFKSVNYNGMIGILAAGIQELNGKTEKLGLSDAQVKTNINNFNALTKVKTLNPVQYNFTNQNVPQLTFKNNLDYGFVAQQLETVYPELVDTINIAATYDSLGNVANQAKTLKTVNYKAMSALLTRAIQEQQLIIDSLLQKQSKQDSINNKVQEQLATLAAQINGCCNASGSNQRNANSVLNQLDVELSDKDVIVLDQNVPNPFAEQTSITYNVPQSVGKAQILFYNTNGQLIQTVDIKTRGKGKVNVFAADLSSGLYHYSLVADGKIIDSKKMVRE